MGTPLQKGSIALGSLLVLALGGAACGSSANTLSTPGSAGSAGQGAVGGSGAAGAGGSTSAGATILRNSETLVTVLIVVDGVLYWGGGSSGDGRLARMSVDASGYEVIWSGPQVPSALLSHDGKLYFTADNDFVDGIVASMAYDGSQLELHASTQLSPEGVAVGPQYMYWTVFRENGFIGRVPHGGGAAETWVSLRAKPFDLAIQNDSLIWSEEGQLIDPTEGGVYRQALSGDGPPTTLAVGDFAAGELEVGGDYAYWINRNFAKQSGWQRRGGCRAG